jgi:8-oxo-dGTP pyrophosphatase MutT (NUDIX family)
MPKTISAGVVVTDGSNILLCHVTGSNHWDLPKGKVDPGETNLDAAVRELYEETSIRVSADRLIDLGIFQYKRNKDLSLWLYPVDQIPDPAGLDCLSTFESGKGIHKKEMDGFASVRWEKIGKYVVPDMLRVLTKARESIT